MLSESKQNLLLVSLGLGFGLILAAATYWVYQTVLTSGRAAAGVEFESVEELQRAILERDERDLKEDRSVSLRSIIFPHPDPRIMYDLLPNLSVRFQAVPVKTNSCGMRGPERSVHKEGSTYRVALLGDSFAFGWGVAEDKTFATVLEENLNHVTGGDPTVEVLNLGVPGYSTFQEVALFEEQALDFEPDAVLVYFVSNDFGLPFFIRNVEQGKSLLPATIYAKRHWESDAPAAADQRSKLYEYLNANNPLSRLADLAEERGFAVFLAINPSDDTKLQRKRLWAGRKRKEIQVFSLWNRYTAALERRGIDPKDTVLPNDPHPNATKHRVLGDLLTEVFLPELMPLTNQAS